MDIEQFISSLDSKPEPLTTSQALRALWLDYKGSWDEAHETIQNESNGMAAAIHAYLHRKEGDIWNANYWYREAGRKPFKGSLSAEWEALVAEELARLGL